jgi:cytosine/adenosine deaminase-related metal-dependent hydrolase
MILHNVHIINDGLKNICINNDTISKISSIENVEPGSIQIHFQNVIAFPGLINSHDHLDFNLFPKLGNRIYKNYVEWGDDIHQQNKNVIDEVLKIPQTLRTQWGVYKNLLNGVTTVFNHGQTLKVENNLIDVLQDKNALHSVRLEKNWRWKLNNPFNIKEPYVIHIGEGTDEASYNEINELTWWNKLNKKLTGIHGVAMDAKQAASFQAIIWCPDSNYFLLGETASINELKKTTTIVFGTDSTVSADWNIWNQLRLARQTKLLTDEELIASVTTVPAKLRCLNAGILKENMKADIVITEKKNDDATNAFFATNPEMILMIIKSGNIILFDESLSAQLTSQKLQIELFNRIRINDRFKYVEGNINNLIKQIKQYSSNIFIPVESA